MRDRIKGALMSRKQRQFYDKMGGNYNEGDLSKLSASMIQASSTAKKMKVISVTRTKLSTQDVSKYLIKHEVVRRSQPNRISGEGTETQSLFSKWDIKDSGRGVPGAFNNTSKFMTDKSFNDYTKMELGKDQSASTILEPQTKL